MADRPILFSAPMVRALLAGTKTQTRRVLKHQPTARHQLYTVAHGGAMVVAAKWIPNTGDQGPNAVPCPYGAAGDRLWVREAWARTTVFPGQSWMVVYREGDNRTDYGGPWKPGIHMFRRDSRIALEVTEVRVERLQDISAADCWAEGISHSPDVDPVHEYAELWESINGVGSWYENPWVWAVSFRRADPPPSA